jgi:hypothetical protein
MLTLKVNGSEKKLNIGCRTFVSLDVLLRILESNDHQVTLNGVTIESYEIAKTNVNSGDALELV